MAERLRRWTRNPMGSSRAGSNPARSGWFILQWHFQLNVPLDSNNEISGLCESSL